MALTYSELYKEIKSSIINEYLKELKRIYKKY